MAKKTKHSYLKWEPNDQSNNGPLTTTVILLLLSETFFYYFEGETVRNRDFFSLNVHTISLCIVQF